MFFFSVYFFLSRLFSELYQKLLSDLLLLFYMGNTPELFCFYVNMCYEVTTHKITADLRLANNRLSLLLLPCCV